MASSWLFPPWPQHDRSLRTGEPRRTPAQKNPSGKQMQRPGSPYGSRQSAMQFAPRLGCGSVQGVLTVGERQGSGPWHVRSQPLSLNIPCGCAKGAGSPRMLGAGSARPMSPRRVMAQASASPSWMEEEVPAARSASPRAGSPRRVVARASASPSWMEEEEAPAARSASPRRTGSASTQYATPRAGSPRRSASPVPPPPPVVRTISGSPRPMSPRAGSPRAAYTARRGTPGRPPFRTTG